MNPQSENTIRHRHSANRGLEHTTLKIGEPPKPTVIDGSSKTTIASNIKNSLAVTTLPPMELGDALFTGRTQFIQELHKLVTNSGQKTKDPFQRITAIVGLGGMGKTSCALKYAQEYKIYHKNIAFINAETRESLLSSFILLADRLQISSDDIYLNKQEERQAQEYSQRLAQRIYRHLSTHGMSSLFIFDNAQAWQSKPAVDRHGNDQAEIKERDEVGISKFFPTEILDQYPLFLITSRLSFWDIPGNLKISTMQLDPFSLDETRLFFCTAVQTERGDPGLNSKIEQLHQLLGGLPLALTLAAAFIASKIENGLGPYWTSHPNFPAMLSIAIDEYLEQFHKNSQNFFNLQGKLEDRHFYTNDDKIMATVWTATFEHIERDQVDGQQALDLLNLMAYMPIDRVNLEFLYLLVEGVEVEELLVQLDPEKDPNLQPLVYLPGQQPRVHDLGKFHGPLKLLEKYSMIHQPNLLQKQRPAHLQPNEDKAVYWLRRIVGHKRSIRYHPIRVHGLVQKWTRENLKKSRDHGPLIKFLDYFNKNYDFLSTWFSEDFVMHHILQQYQDRGKNDEAECSKILIPALQLAVQVSRKKDVGITTEIFHKVKILHDLLNYGEQKEVNRIRFIMCQIGALICQTNDREKKKSPEILQKFEFMIENFSTFIVPLFDLTQGSLFPPMGFETFLHWSLSQALSHFEDPLIQDSTARIVHRYGNILNMYFNVHPNLQPILDMTRTWVTQQIGQVGQSPETFFLIFEIAVLTTRTSQYVPTAIETVQKVGGDEFQSGRKGQSAEFQLALFRSSLFGFRSPFSRPWTYVLQIWLLFLQIFPRLFTQHKTNLRDQVNYRKNTEHDFDLAELGLSTLFFLAGGLQTWSTVLYITGQQLIANRRRLDEAVWILEPITSFLKHKEFATTLRNSDHFLATLRVFLAGTAINICDKKHRKPLNENTRNALRFSCMAILANDLEPRLATIGGVPFGDQGERCASLHQILENINYDHNLPFSDYSWFQPKYVLGAVSLLHGLYKDLRSWDCKCTHILCKYLACRSKTAADVMNKFVRTYLEAYIGVMSLYAQYAYGPHVPSLWGIMVPVGIVMCGSLIMELPRVDNIMMTILVVPLLWILLLIFTPMAVLWAHNPPVIVTADNNSTPVPSLE